MPSPPLTPRDVQLLITICSEISSDSAKVNWNNVAAKISIKHGYHAKAGFKTLCEKKLASGGTTTLSEQQTKLVIAAFQEMSDTSGVNFNNVATKMNIKHGYHAKAAFKNLVEKKLGGSSIGQATGDNSAAINGTDRDGDSDEADSPVPVTPKKRASPKKKVGKRNTPVKASAGGPKTPKKSKRKEESPNLEPESEEYASLPLTPPTEQEDFADQKQEISSSNQILAEERSEAAMMGLTVEEFRMLSAEELDRERQRAPTPGGCADLDDVV